jgi:outer membrane protein assembly factor BamB
VLGIGLLAVLLSGCWPTPGAGPDRRSHNPYERTLTPESVGRLTERFRSPLAGEAGPPVVTSGGLFVRVGLSIAAFEPQDGAPRWTVPLPAAGWDDPSTTISDPHIVGGGRNLVVATVTTQRGEGIHESQLVGLAADSGSLVRRPAAGTLSSLRGTDVATVDFVPGFGIEATSLELTDLEGTKTWGGLSFEARGGTASLSGGRLYLATGDQVQEYDTTAECPPYSGTQPPLICATVWVRPLGSPVTPVVIGDSGTVYVASASAIVYALNRAGGGIRWRAVIGSPVTRAPALDGDTLFVASTDGRLSALPAGGCGSPSCDVQWSTAAGSELTVQPAVAGGVVYVGSADGTVRAFDADGCGTFTCAPLWTANAGAPVTGGLAVSGGRLYVGTANALVGYALPAT